MLDVLIRGGTVVSSAANQPVDVGIEGGVIAGLYRRGAAPQARTVLDASGRYVLPGAIDAHVHTRAPARPDRESWESGTAAAARGGVTTILEMPTSDPCASTPEVIRRRVRTGEESALVDFALYGAGAWGDVGKTRALADEGVIGYKILSHGAPPGRATEFQGMCATTNAELYAGLAAVATTGLPCAVHAEDESLLEQGVRDRKAHGTGAPIEHARSRPSYVEAASIATLLVLAEETGARLHLPHVSSASGLRLAADARTRGRTVTVETCPHYLEHEASLLDELGGFAKMNPPLRSADDRASLWTGIRESTVDLVASDHAPYLFEEKSPSDIWAAAAGNPGLETLCPVLYDAALTGRITLNKAVELLVEGPARVFDLPQKASVTPGKDADIVIVDPNKQWKFNSEQCLSKAARNYRMYEGRKFRGAIETVLSRGRTVCQGGTVIASPGSGRYITRNSFQ